MNKATLSPKSLGVTLATICCFAALVLFCSPLQAASVANPAEGGLVIVLPFQATGDNAARLEDEIPMALSQRLAAKGIPVMPYDQAFAMLTDMGFDSIDVNTVHLILARTGAEAAIYGSYTQVGKGFNINARLVNADEAGAKAFLVEQEDAANLLFGVEDLAGHMVSELRKFSVIAKVEVRGTQALDPEVVLLRINSRQGDPIDPAVLDRELKRIWDLGYFSNIVLELEQTKGGINLIYNVTEKPRISRILINGNKELKSSDIRGVMSTNPGNVLNDKTLFVDMQAIYEAYRKKGYYLAQVHHSLEEDASSGGTSLIINVSEGNRLYITEINVTGNSEISSRTIRKQMALSKRGFFSFITGSGVLKEELLERDTAAITQHYMTHGYLDVVVSTPQVEYKETGIAINVNISEGKRYRVAGIGFSGELIDSDAVLSERTELQSLARKNDYFDISIMQRDLSALKNFYSDYGYAFAEATPRQRKDNSDPQKPTVFVTYHLVKNQKVYVRNVIIEGNAHTRDNVVLREMRLVDGDQFSGSKLRRSIRRLNSLGYFESAEAELVPTTNDSEVDLKIKLRERSTGSIMGGIGYSTYSKFGVMASIEENNLFGKGYNLGFHTLFSGMRNSYNIGFTNPRVNDTNLMLGLDAFRWEDDYTDYDRDSNGAGIRLGYPIGEYTSAMLGYKVNFYKLSNFDDDVSRVLRQYEGNRVSSVGTFRLTRDTTDKSRPTDGTMIQFTTEYGGGALGGDDNFIKLIGEYNVYKLITENSVAHLRLKGGAMFKNAGEESPPMFERFWMGGMESVRGYRARDIVPRDPKYGDRIGGTRMAFANLEYIIMVSKDIGLNIVPFFDVGFNIDHNQNYDINDELKRSVGAELRWRSPLGDLRFSYGYPLDDAWDGDKLGGRFEFSIGRFF